MRNPREFISPLHQNLLFNRVDDVNSRSSARLRTSYSGLFIVRKDIDAVIVFRKIVYAT